jgi:uncharacterized metal-binding protein YceD (DUF177 family)
MRADRIPEVQLVIYTTAGQSQHELKFDYRCCAPVPLPCQRVIGITRQALYVQYIAKPVTLFSTSHIGVQSIEDMLVWRYEYPAYL